MNRDTQIVANVESALQEPFARLAQQNGMSVSAYTRKLIIEALYNADLLPPAFMAQLLKGG